MELKHSLKINEKLTINKGNRRSKWVVSWIGRNANLKTFLAPFLGSFCRYRGTDYVQQKKQYNQTMKPPGELYCLVSLVMSLFLPTRQIVPGLSRIMQGNVSADFSRRYRDIWLTEDAFSYTLWLCLYYDKRCPEANLILSILCYLHAIVGL